MKLGFIGTGQITKAVITGIINSKLQISKIFQMHVIAKKSV